MSLRSLPALLGAVALGGCSLVGVRTEEQPAYEVVDRLGGPARVEVRRYGDRLAAETVVDVGGGVRRAQGDAFRALAGFIFGANQGNRKVAMTAPVEIAQGPRTIAMTAPVETTVAGNSGLTMRFFMPAAYTRDTLPTPTDDRVRVVDVPGETLAVLRFAGRGTPEVLRGRGAELLRALKGTAWQATGKVEPVAFFYDPPWTVPFLRRNEVAVAVRLRAAP